MSKDINVTDGTVLETLNNKVDLDGGNYPGSGLEAIVKKNGGGGGLEIGDIGIAPLGIDETKGKRRYLNGQVIIQERYVQFTNKVKSAVALYPSLACTESEWQTAATMTVGGQVGKFVVDDNAGTIRLPKIIMPIQGLTDLSKLAEIVEAGLPNINGYVGGIAFDSNGTGASSGALKLSDSTLQTVNGHHLTDYRHTWKDIALNASLSNPIYGNSNTVQQEQIQYPYFIQVATGAETEDNIINEIELNNPFSLLDYKYSEYELNNLSWLRSEGQYNSKAVYPAVYDLLLKIYNGTETKAGVSVKLSTEAYTDYDFVLNTADETFRLQLKVKQKFLNAINDNMPVVGTGKALGVTDGTNTLSWASDVSGTRHPACTDSGVKVGSARNTKAGPIRSNVALGITTDPTKSGLIAKVSQSEVSGLYLYFYVGETVQNANLVNIGRIQETYTTKSMVDGQIIKTGVVILLNTTRVSTFELDLSEILPNDGFDYDLYLTCTLQTPANYNTTAMELNSAKIELGNIAQTNKDATNTAYGTSNIILPIGTDRKITCKIVGSSSATITNGRVMLRGYRRIGTNL